MKLLLTRLLGRAGGFSDVEPLLALFLGGGLLAVFLTTLFHRKAKAADGTPPSLLWTLYVQFGVLLWALFLVSLLMGGLSTLRSYLHQTVSNFQHDHGRITDANLQAVQTIWGPEQQQGDLGLSFYWDEEVTERIESEDTTKPAIIRKKTVRHDVTANPFLFARHEVTLTQNARKKGSAYYGGYDTDCHFHWRTQNPTDRELKSEIKFPLPADGAMYNDVTATLNGKDILPQMQLKEASLNLARTAKPNEVTDFEMSFKSRGMSSWYMQVKEAREIRDFTLTLTLPDVAKAHLNNPEGCMSPTDVKPTTNGQGSVLTYRLDHAISSKGMGIALPAPPQPGATTNAVLGETERSWLLIFALLVLGLTMASVRHAVLISLLFGAAIALGYGLLGDFSDLLFGFWGTALIIMVPIFFVLAKLLKKVVPGTTGKLMARQMLLFGILLPCLAGLDSDRQSLYLDLCAGIFLAFITWQLVSQLIRRPEGQAAPA
jgi:hypothetical protein